MFLSLFDSRRERLISQRFAARFVSQLFAALRVPVAARLRCFRALIHLGLGNEGAVVVAFRNGERGGCPA